MKYNAKNKVVLLSTLVALSGAVALVWLGITRESPASARTADWRIHRPAMHPRPVNERALTPGGPARMEPPEMKKGRSNQTGKERIHEELRVVLEKNRDIAQFRTLRLKALPSADERARLHGMYADLDLIRSAKAKLVGTGGDAFSKEGEIERMYSVEFLGRAADWEANPEREVVLATIEEVILADNISSGQPPELRRSLAGDKMELYNTLLQDEPEKAGQIKQTAEGTAVEALLAYAEERYEVASAAEASERD